MAITVLSIGATCVDEGVSIGKYCYIGFGSRLFSDEFDITVIGKEVVISLYTAIGRQCINFPIVGPSELATKFIPSGAIVR